MTLNSYRIKKFCRELDWLFCAVVFWIYGCKLLLLCCLCGIVAAELSARCVDVGTETAADGGVYAVLT